MDRCKECSKGRGGSCSRNEVVAIMQEIRLSLVDLRQELLELKKYLYELRKSLSMEENK